MSNITQYPSGITDLLKVRDLGALPGDVSRQLALVIDATVPYLNNIRETRTDTNAVAAVGNNLFQTNGQLVVPQNEIWYVHHLTMTATAGAGELISLAPSATVPGNVNAQFGAFDSASAGQLASVFADRSFWALPGTEFGFLCKAVTGPPTVFGVAIVSRLRV